jgi:hypothetical protein
MTSPELNLVAELANRLAERTLEALEHGRLRPKSSERALTWRSSLMRLSYCRLPGLSFRAK